MNSEGVEIVPYDYEMKINLTNDVPIHCNPRRFSYSELLCDGIIRPSDSPYASAIVLVKK